MTSEVGSWYKLSMTAIDLYEIDWGTEATRSPGDDAVSEIGAAELTLAVVKASNVN